MFGPDQIIDLQLRRFLRRAGPEVLAAFKNSEAPVWRAVGEAAGREAGAAGLRASARGLQFASSG